MSPPLPVGCDVVDEMITVSNVKLSAAIDRHVPRADALTGDAGRDAGVRQPCRARLDVDIAPAVGTLDAGAIDRERVRIDREIGGEAIDERRPRNTVNDDVGVRDLDRRSLQRQCSYHHWAERRAVAQGKSLIGDVSALLGLLQYARVIVRRPTA